MRESCFNVRFEEDIQPLSDSLSKVLAMRGTRFNWNRQAFPEMGFEQDQQIGFIGQEVEEVCPEVAAMQPRSSPRQQIRGDCTVLPLLL